MPENNAETQTPNPILPDKKRSSKQKSLELIFNIFMGIIVIVLLAILFWVSKPYINEWLPEKPTTTPTSTSTPSPVPTQPPTFTPTITFTPTVTPTPAPISVFKIQDMQDVYPEVPGYAQTVHILNEDNSTQVDPPFENPQWYSSQAIGQQLGVQFSEPFYATYGAGKITWSMDIPLEQGLYEVYVLDTSTSSGGYLDFVVSMNDIPLQPILGQSRARYKSSVTNPPQSGDRWIHIGTYRFDPSGIVKVSTSWDDRDEFSIVAVDRVLIVELPESSLALAAPFPQERMTFIMDDTLATIEMQDIIYSSTERLAWGNQYQFAVNPNNNITVSWKHPDWVPVGQYEIFVWIPQVQGAAQAEYALLVNEAVFLNDDGTDKVIIQHGGRDGGQWVSLGSWTIPSIYGNVINLSLQLQASGGTAGEIAFDAVAFMKKD